MDKEELRSKYKEKRSHLSHEEVHLLSLQIFNQLTNNFNLTGKTIHLFSSIKKFKEINTFDWLDELFKLNCRVATSIMGYRPFSLKHSIITPNTTYENDQFGIPTPNEIQTIDEQDIDIVIIPLLTFDKKGNRIGYGKGIYDRFLSNCKQNTIKIGVSFFAPTEEIRDLNKFDVKLNYCITPQKIYSFNESK